MKELLKKILFGHTEYDHLIEGVYAHEYQDEIIKKKITEQYIKKHSLEVTPITDPLKFDPLNPPDGWTYDPYYELWIKHELKR
jgi:hypothetical protein